MDTFPWSHDRSVPLNATTLDKRNFSLRGECPHCKAKSVFVSVTSVYVEPLVESLRGVRQIIHNLHCSAMQCQGCRNFIRGIAKSLKSSTPVEFSYVTHFPVGYPNDFVSDDIPNTIREDFREALRCHWVEAYNATAEMCRRAIEASCIEFGAKPEDRIGEKIDWVQSKGLITTPLRDMARKIKLGGDRGAHPSQRMISKEDADALIEFTREYFDHVYVMPAKMAEFDFSNNGKDPAVIFFQSSPLPIGEGGFDVFPKPFQASALVEKVREVISLSSMNCSRRRKSADSKPRLPRSAPCGR